MNNLNKSVARIIAERDRQKLELNWSESNDDLNNVSEWAAAVAYYATRGVHYSCQDVEVQAAGFIKAAALCIAALEALERNGRFPDRHFE